MITLIRTDFHNLHFQELVRALDAELSIMDGEEHEFYDQFNKIDSLRFAVLAIKDKEPIGCGAMRMYSQETMEIKRMYVPVKYRNQGIATLVLLELENWAREMNSSKCILETSIKQPDAIALYRKCGYGKIPNYDQYAEDKNSICFEKVLTV